MNDQEGINSISYQTSYVLTIWYVNICIRVDTDILEQSYVLTIWYVNGLEGK